MGNKQIYELPKATSLLNGAKFMFDNEGSNDTFHIEFQDFKNLLSSSFSTSFTNTDLTSGGILNVNHSLDSQFPISQIVNNDNNLIGPDDITFTDADNLDVDLSTYYPITGTWNLTIQK